MYPMKATSVPKVDRCSPMPVYQQIADDIVSRIAQEEWSIGGKLPSEHDLSEEYGASRVTVRQALARLENDGLIDKQQGRGIFLKANPRRTIQDLYLPQPGVVHHFNNKSVGTTITEVDNATVQVYSQLHLKPGTKLIYLERAFVRKGKTVGINHVWFPYDLVPGMADQPLIDESITTTLQQRYHIFFHSVENFIESVMVDAAMASQLGASSLSPALKISSLYKVKDGTPVEFAITTWNGQDTVFRAMISSDTDL